MNSPFITNPDLISIKIGDYVTLKEQIDKNEPRYAYEVCEINFRKSLMKIKRLSGQDKKESEPKWISFKLIHSVHPSKSHETAFINEIQRLNQIEFMKEDFQVEFHHSLGKIQNLTTETILKNFPVQTVLHLDI